MGQAAGDQSELCEHFAKVCTNTYEWMPISAADVQKLVALEIPVQVMYNEEPSDLSPLTGIEQEQRYVFKTSERHSQKA